MAAPTNRSRMTWTVAAVLAVGLAGCAPVMTQNEYSPSDGVRASIDDQVNAENLLVVAESEGGPGVLTGGLTNVGDDATSVTVSIGGLTLQVPVEVGQTILLSAPDARESTSLGVQDISIAAVPAPPGATTDVTLSTPEGGSVTVAVPVVDGTLSPYDQLLPS